MNEIVETNPHGDVIWMVGDKPCIVQKFIFTYGLLVNYETNGIFVEYSHRYCYENLRDAMAALIEWDGNGDPPGPWIKEKVSERLGPGAIK